MPRFAANLTLLFNEVPMLDRPGWATRCGFDGVEVLFPYDHPIADWQRIIDVAQRGSGQSPVVKSFFDEPTNTVSYVIHDPKTREAAVVDSVLDYDPAAGRTSFTSADALIAYATAEKLTVTWLLETHAHADHLSAAPYLKEKLGGTVAIGRETQRLARAIVDVARRRRDLRERWRGDEDKPE